MTKKGRKLKIYNYPLLNFPISVAPNILNAFPDTLTCLNLY